MTSALVATTRPALERAHDTLKGQVSERITAARTELGELEQAVAVAQERKWAVRALRAQAKRAERYVTFLEKVEGALSAGYTVVPNFDMDLLAVRTDRAVSGLRDTVRPVMGARQLPIGQGQYVAPQPEFTSWTETQTRKDGSTREVTWYVATEHAPVAVPMVLMQRDLADALHEAMAERLFDEIGVVHDTSRRDPILVGRVLHPKARLWDRRGLSFFLGWWFDPRAIAP